MVEVAISDDTAQRLDELLGEQGEIQPGFPGLNEEDAVEAIQIIYGVSEAQARLQLAFARGETEGCLGDCRRTQ